MVACVPFAVEFERRGLVVDGGRRREDGLHVVYGIVERRRIDKRFEDRARLAVRQGVIELALPVIPSADNSLDFPIPRVERDQRHLHLWNGFVTSFLGQLALPFVIPFRQQRVHVLHAGFDGRDRVALERRVERRVHAEVLAQQFVLGVFVEQVVVHLVHEIRRFSSGRRATENHYTRFLGLFQILRVV